MLSAARRLRELLASMRSVVVRADGSRRCIYGLSGLMLAAGPQLALAQGSSSNIMDLRFDLSAVLEDNIARSSDALAGQRGLEPEDVVISPTLTLNIVQQVGAVELGLAGSVGYRIYSKNEELNRESIALSARARFQLGPCRVDPTVGIRRGQSDLGDIVFLPTPGADSTKNVETVQSYGIDLGCGRNPGLQPFAGISYERADNSNPLRERAEFDAVTYRGGLRYVSDAVGEISLFGSRRSVDLSPLAAATSGSSYRDDRVNLQLQRDIGTRIKTAALVGYSRLSSDSPQIDEFNGLVWDIQLTALVGPNLRLTAGTGRQVGNSLASDASVVVSKPHRVRLEYAFSDRARLSAGAGLTERSFSYATPPGPLVITRERRQTYDAAMAFDIGQRFELRLFGGHERRNANGDIFDYSANFVGASIGLRF